jgi:hypothetical protein
METGGTSGIQIILWVLAANVGVILLAYGLVAWWKSEAQSTVRKLGVSIQEHDNRLAELKGFLQSYHRVQQEPFATPLNELQTDIDEMQEQLEAFLKTGQSFDEELRTGGGNKLLNIIASPFIWFRRWGLARAMKRESGEIGVRLVEAENRVQRIHDIPWDLAIRARQAGKDVDEINNTARELQTKGARGSLLQTVVNQGPQLDRALDEIPDPFYVAGREELIAAANLDATIRTYEALIRIDPAIQRYLPQVREWKTSFEKATTEYTGLKQAGAALRQAMAKPPEGLSISALQGRLDQMAQHAAELGQRVAQPDVSELKNLAREASQLRKVISDTEQQYSRASKQVSDLGQAIVALDRQMTLLSEQFSRLESHPAFPIIWDTSREQLAGLRKRLDGLGPALLPRSPEQIGRNLKEIDEIRAGLKALAEAHPRAAGMHSALVEVLESGEIKEGAAWLRKARETAEQASIYDAKNWSRQEAVHTLPTELNDLESEHQRLGPSDLPVPLKESDLEQRLNDTQQLAAQHKALRARVESARGRLEKIQEIEKTCKDRLTESWNALERIALLAESNPLIEQTAGADIDRMGEEIRHLGNDLNAQSQGEIEKKAQKINAQVDKVNRAMNSWLAQLTGSILEQGRQISQHLAEIDAVGMIEDGPVQQARTLLARQDYLSVSQTAASQPSQSRGAAPRSVAARITRSEAATALNDLEVTAEIKRRNDLWQALQAANKALEEKCGPLFASFQETTQARNEARDKVAEIAQHLPSKPTWPPSDQSALPDAQGLRPVDDKWEALKRQPTRADGAILEMGRLAQQYRMVTERAGNLIGRIEQDQERIQEAEWQIEELKQRWQAQAQADPNNPIVREGVRTLMSQADSRLAYIKHQYMRGALTYEQVLHNLRLLYDELHAARVSVDDQHDIGLNENRAQSTR